MRCVTIREFGPPDVLKPDDLPPPEIADGEVLVAVRATSVNPIDTVTRAGQGVARNWSGNRFPAILGWDVSGVVAESKSSDFKPGDEVFGLVRFPELAGAYAEYVAAPAADVALKPASIDHLHAAAVPLVGLTAWQALFDDAGLEAGQTILVHAGAGGVGHMAVQYARWKGAEVVATASAANREFLLDLGVKEVVDYTKEDFGERIRGVDVVLHSLGPKERPRSYRTLKKGGILIALLYPTPEPGEAEAFGARAKLTLVHPSGAQLREIAAAIDEGGVAPHVDRVFPLEDVAAAHSLVEKRHTRGKIVVEVSKG